MATNRSLVASAAAIAILIALVAFPAAAAAQQAEASVVHFDNASDLANFWSYYGGYPWSWEVDSSPVAGVSGASMNWNNGSDVQTSDYGYVYGETNDISVSGLDTPQLVWWCKADFGSIYQDRYIEIHDTNYNFDQYLYMGPGQQLDCDSSGAWHQHVIDLDPSLVSAGSFRIYFWNWFDIYGGGSGYEGLFIDEMQILVPDATPPDAIADLAAANPTLTEIEVDWSAPHDNDISGVTASFDLRYSTSPITGTNFDSATQVNGEPAPGAEGTPASVLVTGLTQNTTYFFAIRTTDIAGNVSPVSNVPSLATLAPPPPPPPPPAAPPPPPELPPKNILPCSAGTSAAPTGLMALAGLIALAFALRRKA